LTKCFAILARPRTGSNHLVSLLDSHPEIRCYGEIFRPKYRLSARVDPRLARFDDHARRITHAHVVLRKICKLDERSAWARFKVFPNHVDMQVAPLRRGIAKVVSLTRENDLAIYSSARTAQVNRQGATRVGEVVERVRVRFEAAAFDRFRAGLDEERAFCAKIRDRFAPEDRFEIAYSEINDPARLQALQEFLGVAPAPLVSAMQKRNPPDILARFETIDADFATIARQCGFPASHHALIDLSKKTAHRAARPIAMTPAILGAIETLYAEDFARFGYDPEPPAGPLEAMGVSLP